MRVILGMLLPLLATVIITLIWAIVIYCFYRMTLKSKAKMVVFLDKHYDLMRKKGFWGKEQEFIDAQLIRSSGYGGWSFIGLPTILLSLSPEIILSYSGLAMIVLLFFGGESLAKARALLFCMKTLGLAEYKPGQLVEDNL